jgi:hypothetical protein
MVLGGEMKGSLGHIYIYIHIYIEQIKVWVFQPVHAKVASAVVEGFWSVDLDSSIYQKLGLGEMSVVIWVLEIKHMKVVHVCNPSKSLAPLEAGIKRITVQGQYRQIVCHTPSPK